MKIYQTILILFITLSLSAQVEVYPTSYDLHVQSDSSLHDFVFTVVNNDTKTTEVYWMIEFGDDWPVNWQLTTCDLVLCYAPNTLKCPNNNPNVLLPGDKMKLKISLNSFSSKGMSSMTLKLFSMPDCNGEFFVSESGEIQVGGTTNTFDFDLKPTAYSYPNPTQDYLEIKNDEEVRSIELFDYSSKLHYNSSHVNGQIHDINHLTSGIYILKMLTSDGQKLLDQVVKVE